MEMEKMQKEFEYKSQLIQLQNGFQGQVKQAEFDLLHKKEMDKEDRKDERTKLQATQQSKMINQRQQDSSPIDFNEEDSLGGMDDLFKVD
jgi:hypothetical protein